MKKLYIFLALVFLSVTAWAQNGRQLYNKYSDSPDMEAVYISPAMFRMIGRIPDVKFQDGEVNFSSLVKSMSGFYILNTSNASVGEALYGEVKKFVQSGAYELLMEAKENGSAMRMYTTGDEKTVTSFVMLAREGNEVSFISFDGKMNREELENILAEAARDK